MTEYPTVKLVRISELFGFYRNFLFSSDISIATSVSISPQINHEHFLDLAIERVFKEDGGVLGFLKLAMNQCKIFKTENAKSFDLLCKIIELYPKKVVQYATNTVIVSILLVVSNQSNRLYLFSQTKKTVSCNENNVIFFVCVFAILNRFAHNLFVRCKHQQRKRRRRLQ